jgi:hypothetical protein
LLESAVQEAFEYYGLIWPKIMDSLDYRMAIELQNEAVEDDDE